MDERLRRAGRYKAYKERRDKGLGMAFRIGQQAQDEIVAARGRAAAEASKDRDREMDRADRDLERYERRAERAQDRRIEDERYQQKVQQDAETEEKRYQDRQRREADERRAAREDNASKRTEDLEYRKAKDAAALEYQREKDRLDAQRKADEEDRDPVKRLKRIDAERRIAADAETVRSNEEDHLYDDEEEMQRIRDPRAYEERQKEAEYTRKKTDESSKNERELTEEVAREQRREDLHRSRFDRERGTKTEDELAREDRRRAEYDRQFGKRATRADAVNERELAEEVAREQRREDLHRSRFDRERALKDEDAIAAEDRRRAEYDRRAGERHDYYVKRYELKRKDKESDERKKKSDEYEIALKKRELDVANKGVKDVKSSYNTYLEGKRRVEALDQKAKLEAIRAAEKIADGDLDEQEALYEKLYHQYRAQLGVREAYEALNSEAEAALRGKPGSGGNDPQYTGGAGDGISPPEAPVPSRPQSVLELMGGTPGGSGAPARGAYVAPQRYREDPNEVYPEDAQVGNVLEELDPAEAQVGAGGAGGTDPAMRGGSGAGGISTAPELKTGAAPWDTEPDVLSMLGGTRGGQGGYTPEQLQALKIASNAIYPPRPENGRLTDLRFIDFEKWLRQLSPEDLQTLEAVAANPQLAVQFRRPEKDQFDSEVMAAGPVAAATGLGLGPAAGVLGGLGKMGAGVIGTFGTAAAAGAAGGPMDAARALGPLATASTAIGADIALGEAGGPAGQFSAPGSIGDKLAEGVLEGLAPKARGAMEALQHPSILDDPAMARSVEDAVEKYAPGFYVNAEKDAFEASMAHGNKEFDTISAAHKIEEALWQVSQDIYDSDPSVRASAIARRDELRQKMRDLVSVDPRVGEKYPWAAKMDADVNLSEANFTASKAAGDSLFGGTRIPTDPRDPIRLVEDTAKEARKIAPNGIQLNAGLDPTQVAKAVDDAATAAVKFFGNKVTPEDINAARLVAAMGDPKSFTPEQRLAFGWLDPRDAQEVIPEATSVMRPAYAHYEGNVDKTAKKLNKWFGDIEPGSASDKRIAYWLDGDDTVQLTPKEMDAAQAMKREYDNLFAKLEKAGFVTDDSYRDNYITYLRKNGKKIFGDMIETSTNDVKVRFLQQRTNEETPDDLSAIESFSAYLRLAEKKLNLEPAIKLIREEVADKLRPGQRSYLESYINRVTGKPSSFQATADAAWDTMKDWAKETLKPDSKANPAKLAAAQAVRMLPETATKAALGLKVAISRSIIGLNQGSVATNAIMGAINAATGPDLLKAMERYRTEGYSKTTDILKELRLTAHQPPTKLGKQSFSDTAMRALDNVLFKEMDVTNNLTVGVGFWQGVIDGERAGAAKGLTGAALEDFARGAGVRRALEVQNVGGVVERAPILSDPYVGLAMQFVRPVVKQADTVFRKWGGQALEGNGAPLLKFALATGAAITAGQHVFGVDLKDKLLDFADPRNVLGIGGSGRGGDSPVKRLVGSIMNGKPLDALMMTVPGAVQGKRLYQAFTDTDREERSKDSLLKGKRDLEPPNMLERLKKGIFGYPTGREAAIKEYRRAKNLPKDDPGKEAAIDAALKELEKWREPKYKDRVK